MSALPLAETTRWLKYVREAIATGWPVKVDDPDGVPTNVSWSGEGWACLPQLALECEVIEGVTTELNELRIYPA